MWIVLVISPRGIRSIWERTKTAVTTVPFPGWDSMEKLPPVLSAAYLKKGTPSPTFRVVRVVKKGSVTWATCSGVIPQPLSLMTTDSRSALQSADMQMVIKEAPARVEFSATSRIFKEISGIMAY